MQKSLQLESTPPTGSPIRESIVVQDTIHDVIPYFLTSMDEAPPAPPITPKLVIK